MIDDPRNYSAIIANEVTFNKSKDDAFVSNKWERIKNQPSSRLDRHYIKLMTS